MRRSTLSAAAVLASTVLVLSACGGEEDTEASDSPSASETTETTPSEEPTEEPSEEPSEPPADVEVTAPGTELAVGDSATVPVTSSDDEEGVIELTVTEIRKGDASDLDEVEGAEGFTPYLISWSATAVSNAAGLAGYDPGEDLRGFQGDGRPGGTLVSTSSLDGCESGEVPDDWAEGETTEGCFDTLGTSPITNVIFNTDDTEYDQYDGKPILWK